MIEEILNNIKNTTYFREYTEFKLEKTYFFKDVEHFIKKLKVQNVEIIYNKITGKFDNIGVIDLNNKRYYDFDDNIWTLTNKGINGTEQY